MAVAADADGAATGPSLQRIGNQGLGADVASTRAWPPVTKDWATPLIPLTTALTVPMFQGAQGRDHVLGRDDRGAAHRVEWLAKAVADADQRQGSAGSRADWMAS